MATLEIQLKKTSSLRDKKKSHAVPNSQTIDEQPELANKQVLGGK